MRDEKVLIMVSRNLGIIKRGVNWMVAVGSKGQERLGGFCILEWKCISLQTGLEDGTDNKGEFEKKRVVLPRWLLLEWKVVHPLISCLDCAFSSPAPHIRPRL